MPVPDCEAREDHVILKQVTYLVRLLLSLVPCPEHAKHSVVGALVVANDPYVF